MGVGDIGGPLGGFNPLGNMGGISGGVMGSMMGAAAAVGVPGYSMAPLALPLIASVVGPVRSSYFGSTGMQAASSIAWANGDIQRGVAPGNFGGMALSGVPQMMGGAMMTPDFVAPLMATWAAMNAPPPATTYAGGPSQAPAPMPMDDVDPVEGKHKKKKADDDGDAAPAAKAEAKADTPKAEAWKDDVMKVKIPGARVAGADETADGKHRVRLEPDSGTGALSRQTLNHALRELHHKHVDTVVVKDVPYKTGSFVTPKKEERAGDKKAAPKRVWSPTGTPRILKALIAQTKAAAPKKEPVADSHDAPLAPKPVGKPPPMTEQERQYAYAVVGNLGRAARKLEGKFEVGHATTPHSARFVAPKDESPEDTADAAYTWVKAADNGLKRDFDKKVFTEKPKTPTPVRIVLEVPADKVKAVEAALAKKFAAGGLEYVGKVAFQVDVHA